MSRQLLVSSLRRSTGPTVWSWTPGARLLSNRVNVEEAGVGDASADPVAFTGVGRQQHHLKPQRPANGMGVVNGQITRHNGRVNGMAGPEEGREVVRFQPDMGQRIPVANLSALPHQQLQQPRIGGMMASMPHQQVQQQQPRVGNPVKVEQVEERTDAKGQHRHQHHRHQQQRQQQQQQQQAQQQAQQAQQQQQPQRQQQQAQQQQQPQRQPQQQQQQAQQQQQPQRQQQQQQQQAPPQQQQQRPQQQQAQRPQQHGQQRQPQHRHGKQSSQAQQEQPQQQPAPPQRQQAQSGGGADPRPPHHRPQQPQQQQQRPQQQQQPPPPPQPQPQPQQQQQQQRQTRWQSLEGPRQQQQPSPLSAVAEALRPAAPATTSPAGSWADLPFQQGRLPSRPQQEEEGGSGSLTRQHMDQGLFNKYRNVNGGGGGRAATTQPRGGPNGGGGVQSLVAAMGIAIPQPVNGNARLRGGLFQGDQSMVPQGQQQRVQPDRQQYQQGKQLWGDVRQPRRHKQQKRPRLPNEDWARRVKLLRKVPLVLPHEPLTVRELSRKLAMKMDYVMKRLVALGEPRGIEPDTLVDLDTAELLGLEVGRKVTRMGPSESLAEYRARPAETRPEWPLRAPVVCVMGHVDHGKTTLLDALRKTQVAAGEAGGITQRLGAFHLKQLQNGGVASATSSSGVTFLDTPGHAAFSEMRVNGASATDIVLVVVSATDGIQAQTEEVLRLVSKEGSTVMVAVTKVDKLGDGEGEVAAAVAKVEEQLAVHGIMSEAMGGEVQVVPVSAVSGQGLDDLVERLALQAEIMELRADDRPTAPAEAVVLDCSVEKGLGNVLNVLVRWGTLKPGDVVVAGQQYARVRKVLDGSGKALDMGRPSVPVRLLGFKDLPAPGDELVVVPDEDRARRIVEARARATEQERLEAMQAVEMLDEEEITQLQEAAEATGYIINNKTRAYLLLQQQKAADGTKDLPPTRVVVPFVIKADGKGLLDALTASLSAYDSDVIKAEVIGAGCGAITAGDVELAKAAGDAVLLGFGVGFASNDVAESARREKLPVHRHTVIYSLLDRAKAELQERMPFERVETLAGRLEVQQVFALSGKRRTKHPVAGCRVVHGSAFSNAATYRYRVLRDGEVLCDESPPHSLNHFKETVQEVTKGQECGLSLELFGEYEPGDVIECYTVTEKRKDVADIFPF